MAAALAATAALAGAAPAKAAIPAVAETWATFMYRSLTVTATGAHLRRILADQRAAVRTRAGEVTAATAANDTARKRAAAAAATDTAARARLAAARQAVTEARRKLNQLKPRQKAAIARARTAVTAAEQRLTLRRTQARNAATGLATARTGATAAATALTRADRAARSASAAVVATQQRIAALKTPAELAAAAAVLSRDVVTAVRPAFTTVDTRVVYGTTVHRNVAYSYRRMVDDAQRAGISISGGGFRTRQRQIELRKINGCPDVWKAPSSSCRVPTAIPGRSLHEIGLAVDVTSGGRSLTSKSAAFKWLKVHADEYGFVNLPSEPWHWSITGG